MSSFRPLNVIFEDESEDEIDDSKEIQIEEALKLYQNALKLHSQGPQYFEEAEAAYQELFRSEIFTYPESLSESKWLELYGDVDIPSDADDEDVDFGADLDVPTTSSDGTPSTLPQILYLAYKNHGMFRLDRLKYRLGQIEAHLRPTDIQLASSEVRDSKTIGLGDFAEALGRDETDLELWRRVARVSEYLGSARLARYCLEAVVDTGDAALNDQSGSMGLEELFAKEQLRSLLPKIQDAISEAWLNESSSPQSKLAKALQKHIDPCTFLPETQAMSLSDLNDRPVNNVEVNVPTRSWVAIGKAILFAIQQSAQGLLKTDPGSTYTLLIPFEWSGTSHTLPDNKRPQKPPLPKQMAVTGNGAVHGHVQERNDQMMASPTENLHKGTEASPATTAHGEAEVVADNASETVTEDKGATEGNLAEASVSLPTRKRSSGDAELPESNDAIRARSKRIKARTSAGEPVTTSGESAEEWAKWYSEQLSIYVQADELAFESADSIAAKLQCRAIGPLESLKQAFQDAPESPSSDDKLVAGRIAVQALKKQLDNWTPAKSRALLNGSALHNPAQGPSRLGLSAYLEQSMREKQARLQQNSLPDTFEIDSFVKQTQGQPLESLNELALHWLRHFLLENPHDNQHSPFYESHLWSDIFKETFVKLLVQVDEYVLLTLMDISQHDEKLSLHMVQSIFELHLDIYGRITNPSSIVDDETRTLQRDRLCRWASFASETINTKQQDRNVEGRHLMTRFLWSTVVCNDLLGSTTSEHTVSCYRDLVLLLQQEPDSNDSDIQIINPADMAVSNNSIAILLVNNALMPELSISAAQKEISRLITMNYFKSIFESSDEDAFAIIDKLEPLLTLSLNSQQLSDETDPISGLSRTRSEGVSVSKFHDPNILIREAKRFLDQASLSLKLVLWQKLRDAYSIINYPSMILACNLRSLALVVEHLESKTYANGSPEHESDSYLHWLHKVDDLMTQALALIMTDGNPFECIDYDHARSLLDALGTLTKIVHVFAFWEDSIRVGQVSPPPQPSSAATKLQIKCAEKFRDMMVKTWTLRYFVLREAIKQNEVVFESPSEDLLNYLKLTHQALGLRTYCGLANKVFLKVAKSEMLRMRSSTNWDMDLPQIVLDLYGLKISSNTEDTQDHACETTEIEKPTALAVLDFVMLHVNRLSMKDLFKSDIRHSVDKIQLVVKAPILNKNTAARSFNKKLVATYLKSPINPVELFRSFRGVGNLCGTPAKTDGWEIAQRGWYFLLGHIALSKFRMRRKEAPCSTEDLEHAKFFFKLDLEFDTEKWETWYRLGQAFDSHLEEHTTWAADKLQNDPAGIVDLQRQAILCYNMALSVANRCADASFEETSKMSELYADFGSRIYSSTREPFSMQAFSLRDFEKHYNGAVRGMYKGTPFGELRYYPAWKLASTLLRQASLQRPNDWTILYMLGKNFMEDV